MSDTDDTNILLLIPPDFFKVHSTTSEDSLLGTSRTVVHKVPIIKDLVSQVQRLESRIESLELESISDISTFREHRLNESAPTVCFNKTSTNLGRNQDNKTLIPEPDYSKSFTYPRNRRKKVFKKRSKKLCTLNNNSLDETLSGSCLDIFMSSNLKKQSSNAAKSIYDDGIFCASFATSNSADMNADLSSIGSSPNRRTDNLLLNEIDEFLTKVDDFENTVTEQSSRISPQQTKNIIVATSEYISKKMHNQALPVSGTQDEAVVKSPSNILDKYIYLTSSGKITQDEPFDYKCNENVDTPKRSSMQSRVHVDNKSEMDYKDIKPSDNNYYRRDIFTEKPNTVRRLNYVKPDASHVQTTSTPKRPGVWRPMNDIDFIPSSNKVCEKAANVLEQHRRLSVLPRVSQLNNSDFPKEIGKDYESRKYIDRHSHEHFIQTSECDTSDVNFSLKERQQQGQGQIPVRRSKYSAKPWSTIKDTRDPKYPDSIDTNLLSLSDLWGKQTINDDKVLERKLEEERMKREHCEAVIQNLQGKVLEQQEKIAVAMRIDKGKDDAIDKLKEAWTRISNRLSAADNRHKLMIQQMNNDLKAMKNSTIEAEKRVRHYEAELYKAIDLAHDYQDKCKQLENAQQQQADCHKTELERLQNDVCKKDGEISELRDNYSGILQLNKQFSECIQKLEETLKEEKHDHGQAKEQLMILKSQIEVNNGELCIIIDEKDILKEKVKEEQARNLILASEKNELQNKLDLSLKREQSLDSELNTLRKHLEIQKNDLKSYYQKQLEDAVMTKLKEFQTQLDTAEKVMDAEMKENERNIAEGYAKRIQRAEEQHKLEVNILEEKQKEEINLYRLQLAQSMEKITTLEDELDSYRRRRGQIASQLHHIMESQWQQACQVLMNNVNNGSADTTTVSNIFGMLDNKFQNTKDGLPYPSTVGSSRIDPFIDDRRPERIPERTHSNQKYFSHRNKTSNDVEHSAELQEYIKMLLTKPVNHLGGSTEMTERRDSYRPSRSVPPEQLEEPTSDRQEDKFSVEKGRDKGSKRDSHTFNTKPPWKC